MFIKDHKKKEMRQNGLSPGNRKASREKEKVENSREKEKKKEKAGISSNFKFWRIFR